MCETKSVKSALYLDLNETLPDVSEKEKDLKKLEASYKKEQISEGEFETTKMELESEIKKGHDYKFVGKVGNFCPVLPGTGGGILLRDQNGDYYAAPGSKGFRWVESELIRDDYNNGKNIIDKSYYNILVDEAVDTISQYGDFEAFAV